MRGPSDAMPNGWSVERPFICFVLVLMSYNMIRVQYYTLCNTHPYLTVNVAYILNC